MTDALAVMALLPAVLPVWRTVMVPETVFLLVEFPEMVFLPLASVLMQMVEFPEAVFLSVAFVLVQMVEFLEVVLLPVASVLMREQGGRSRRSWHIHLCRNLQESFVRKTVP